MSYQSITIVGNLGRDPEIQYTSSGQIVCHFSLASTRIHKEDGKVKKETAWFRITSWGKIAESCHEYLKQGAKVLVEGRLLIDPDTGGPRVYTRQDGSAGASFEVNANTVKFLSKSSESTDEPAAEEEKLLAISF